MLFAPSEGLCKGSQEITSTYSIIPTLSHVYLMHGMLLSSLSVFLRAGAATTSLGG